MDPITEVGRLNHGNYRTVGGTALNDALGRCINETGRKLAAMSEDERPGKVIFMLITDGQENSSSSFSKEEVAGMVKVQENEFAWTFVYLGANVDHIAESQALGINANNALSYTADSKGIGSTYDVVNASVGAIRGTFGEALGSYCLYDGSNDVTDIGEEAVRKMTENIQSQTRQGSTESTEKV
jgi:uncharacterized protein YegL